MAAECSIVIPLHNAAEQLPGWHRRISGVLRQLAIPYEVIYVDNGSSDATGEQLERLHDADETVRGVVLSRRFETRAALQAGLESATGRAVITLNPAREEPPEILPAMISAWHQGYEVVFGRPRTGSFSLKRMITALLTGLLRHMTGLNVPANTGDLVLMDRRVVDQLHNLAERTPFALGLVCWMGFRQMVVEYTRPPRRLQVPGRSVVRQLATVVEAVYAFSTAPLRLIVVMGTTLIVVSLAATLVRVAGWSPLNTINTTVWSLSVVLGALTGVQMVALGVIGGYVARIYREVRSRPDFVSREKIGFLPHPRLVNHIVQLMPSAAATRQERATEQQVRAARQREAAGRLSLSDP